VAQSTTAAVAGTRLYLARTTGWFDRVVFDVLDCWRGAAGYDAFVSAVA
jgi:hypothetical protein